MNIGRCLNMITKAKHIYNFINLLFYVDTYGIAYKKKDNNIYTTIFPTNRYSYADPFVYQLGDKTAIFVELMDYYYGWGTIGVFEIVNNQVLGFKEIIRENYHMSFPNVFCHDGDLYMIPETYNDNSVHLYKCIDFPYDWVRMPDLITGVHLVDHSLLEDDFTYVISYDIDRKCTRCFFINWDELKFEEFYPDGNYSNERPGGTFFTKDNKLFRVIQDCNNRYGEYLKIYEVDGLSRVSFNEHLFKTIMVNDLSFDKNLGFDRVHQYSVSEDFEMIDFTYNRFYWNKLFRYIFRFLFHPNRRNRYFS